MSLFRRAHDIIQAKASKALDAAEKPDEMLDLSYEQMLDHVTQVRRGLVDIAASRRGPSCPGSSSSTRPTTFRTRPRTALAQGNEDLEKEALSRRAAAQAQIDGMEAQHQQFTEQEEKLEQTLAALQKRVNDFRTQKEVLKAQYTAASPESSVERERLGHLHRPWATPGPRFQRAQDKIATMQARAGALDELLQSGVLEDVGCDTDEIQQELDEAGTNAEVDKQLAALKVEIGPGSSPAGAAAGDRPRRAVTPGGFRADTGARSAPGRAGPRRASRVRSAAGPPGEARPVSRTGWVRAPGTPGWVIRAVTFLSGNGPDTAVTCGSRVVAARSAGNKSSTDSPTSTTSPPYPPHAATEERRSPPRIVFPSPTRPS